MKPKSMHIRDAPQPLAFGIEAMLQQAFLCLVSQQPDGVYELPVETVDTLPKGKRMDMVMETRASGPVFVFRVTES